MYSIFKKSLSVLILASLCVACGGESEQKEKPKPEPRGNEGKAGYLAGCKALTGPTDYSKATLDEIIGYLSQACIISEYYTKPVFKEADKGVGSPCFCYGQECNLAGYEHPTRSSIQGCEKISPSHGAVVGCFRSTNKAPVIEPIIHFPNGMCTLVMSKCTASDPNDNTICGFANFGDYSKLNEFSSCPDKESVLVDIEMPVQVSIDADNPSKALLDVRLCLKGCESDADCRSGEFDAIIGAQSQVKCVETKARESDSKKAKVCMDMRSITEKGMSLIHAGKQEG